MSEEVKKFRQVKVGNVEVSSSVDSLKQLERLTNKLLKKHENLLEFSLKKELVG